MRIPVKWEWSLGCAGWGVIQPFSAANFKTSSSGALKLGGEGRDITVARPTKLQHVARGSFEVVPNQPPFDTPANRTTGTGTTTALYRIDRCSSERGAARESGESGHHARARAVQEIALNRHTRQKNEILQSIMNFIHVFR